MTDKQELKAKLMAEIVAESLNGEGRRMGDPMSKSTLNQFLNNVEYIVDEIIKRSSK